MKSTYLLKGKEINISSERLDEIFGKNVTDDNIKYHRKQDFTRFLESRFWEKPQGGGVKLTPLPHLFRLKSSINFIPISHCNMNNIIFSFFSSGGVH